MNCYAIIVFLISFVFAANSFNVPGFNFEDNVKSNYLTSDNGVAEINIQVSVPLTFYNFYLLSPRLQSSSLSACGFILNGQDGVLLTHNNH